MSQSSGGTISHLLGLRTIVRGFPHTDPERDCRQRVEQQLVAEILVAARSLIREPECWCKFSWAEDKDGHPYTPDSMLSCMPRYAAKRFCIEGAIEWAAFWTGHPDHAALAQRATELVRLLVGTSPFRWNDDDATCHFQVVALMDEAVDVALGAAR